MSESIYMFLQFTMGIAVVLSFVLLIPTIYGIVKTHNTTSISKGMYILYPVSNVAGITYAIILCYEPNIEITEVIGIAISEAIAMVIALIILFMKLRNVHEAKMQHMTEQEGYRAYLKAREIKKNLKKMGIKSDKDIKDHRLQQSRLTKVLEQLFTSYEDIVDDRITSSKQYRKNLQRDIPTPKKRLEYFKNIATNAEIANVIHLIYLDIYSQL